MLPGGSGLSPLLASESLTRWLLQGRAPSKPQIQLNQNLHGKNKPICVKSTHLCYSGSLRSHHDWLTVVPTGPLSAKRLCDLLLLGDNQGWCV